MTAFNLTAFEGYDPTAPIEIDALEVIRDLVMQLDDKLILAVILFISAYFFNKAILPMSLEGLKIMRGMPLLSVLCPVLNLAIWFVNFLISLSETFMLGGAVVVLVISYVQGILPGWAVYLLFSILIISCLLGIIKLVGYVRRNKMGIVVEKKWDLENDS